MQCNMSLANVIVVRSCPAPAVFLSGHMCDGPQKRADGCGFSPSTAYRFLPMHRNAGRRRISEIFLCTA